MINKIILASKSGVREKILKENDIKCEVLPANIDEDQIKESLIKEKATPKLISKNLAEKFARNNGKGTKILFLPISFNNFSKISLKVITSGPVHSIIFE